MGRAQENLPGFNVRTLKGMFHCFPRQLLFVARAKKTQGQKTKQSVKAQQKRTNNSDYPGCELFVRPFLFVRPRVRPCHLRPFFVRTKYSISWVRELS